MMYLNTAVAREVSAELRRQQMKPKVLTFWLGVSDRKASALCRGETVWSVADLEAAAEGLGVDLAEMVTRCAARLRTGTEQLG
nr:hypothetical protein [Propionibacterium sp.]